MIPRADRTGAPGRLGRLARRGLHVLPHPSFVTSQRLASRGLAAIASSIDRVRDRAIRAVDRMRDRVAGLRR